MIDKKIEIRYRKKVLTDQWISGINGHFLDHKITIIYIYRVDVPRSVSIVIHDDGTINARDKHGVEIWNGPYSHLFEIILSLLLFGLEVGSCHTSRALDME